MVNIPLNCTVCYCVCVTVLHYTYIADISLEVENQTVHEGDTASFFCQTTGKPIPNISWYFNGAPIIETNATKYMITEMPLNDVAKSSTLTVRNATSSNIGTYSCKAANFRSSDISSAVLTINGKGI